MLSMKFHHIALKFGPLQAGFDASGTSLVAQAVKNLPAMQRPRFSPGVRKIPWRRKWLPTPALLPGESHGQRSPASCRPYSPWGCREVED